MTARPLSDPQLLDMARTGDDGAFAELRSRHRTAATRLAASYRRAGDPEDLVAEAFEEALRALRRGTGPRDGFRAHLFVTLRRVAADRTAREGDAALGELPEPLLAVAATPPLRPADRQLIIDAFESLPTHLQSVLWLTAVEGLAPREVAPRLGTAPDTVSTLAHRARKALRQAHLEAHLAATAALAPGCQQHRSQLGDYLGGGLATSDRAEVAAHLERCGACRAVVADLREVDVRLARALLPVFRDATAAAVATAGASGATAGAHRLGTGTPARRLVARLRRHGLAGRALKAPALAASAVAAATLGAVAMAGLWPSGDDSLGELSVGGVPTAPQVRASSPPSASLPAAGDDPRDEPDDAPDGDPGDPTNRARGDRTSGERVPPSTDRPPGTAAVTRPGDDQRPASRPPDAPLDTREGRETSPPGPEPARPPAPVGSAPAGAPPTPEPVPPPDPDPDPGEAITLHPPTWTPAPAAGTGTLLVTVANDGADPVDGLNVELQFQTGAVTVSDTGLPAACTGSGGAGSSPGAAGVGCDIGVLAAGAQRSVAVDLVTRGEGQRVLVRVVGDGADVTQPVEVLLRS